MNLPQLCKKTFTSRNIGGTANTLCFGLHYWFGPKVGHSQGCGIAGMVRAYVLILSSPPPQKNILSAFPTMLLVSGMNSSLVSVVFHLEHI